MTDKKKFAPRYGRFTETVLSLGCLSLFTLGAGLLVWFPLLYWQGFLHFKRTLLYLVPGVLQLVVWPLGLWLMKYSLLLLHQVEVHSGLWKPFSKRVKKIHRRQKLSQGTWQQAQEPEFQNPDSPQKFNRNSFQSDL